VESNSEKNLGEGCGPDKLKKNGYAYGRKGPKEKEPSHAREKTRWESWGIFQRGGIRLRKGKQKEPYCEQRASIKEDTPTEFSRKTSERKKKGGMAALKVWKKKNAESGCRKKPRFDQKEHMSIYWEKLLRLRSYESKCFFATREIGAASTIQRERESNILLKKRFPEGRGGRANRTVQTRGLATRLRKKHNLSEALWGGNILEEVGVQQYPRGEFRSAFKKKRCPWYVWSQEPNWERPSAKEGEEA